MPRAKSIQIYLNEAVEEDAVLLAAWRACKRHSRPQVVFRHLLRQGLRSAISNGEFSGKLLDEMNKINLALSEERAAIMEAFDDEDGDEQPAEVFLDNPTEEPVPSMPEPPGALEVAPQNEELPPIAPIVDDQPSDAGKEMELPPSAGQRSESKLAPPSEGDMKKLAGLM